MAEEGDALGADQGERDLGFLGEFGGVVGVEDEPQGLFGLEGGGELGRDACGVRGGDAGMDAEEFEVWDGVEGLEEGVEAAGGEHEGVAAGEDDFADFGAGGDVVQGGLELGLGEDSAAGADVFAAEAEAAVYGAEKEGF